MEKQLRCRRVLNHSLRKYRVGVKQGRIGGLGNRCRNSSGRFMNRSAFRSKPGTAGAKTRTRGLNIEKYGNSSKQRTHNSLFGNSIICSPFPSTKKSVQGRRILSGHSKRPRSKRVKTCKAKVRRGVNQGSLTTHQACSQVFGSAKISRDHSRKYLNLSHSHQAQTAKAGKFSSKDRNFGVKPFESYFSSSPSRRRMQKRILTQHNSIESDLSCFTMKENNETNQCIQRWKHLENNDKTIIQNRLVMQQNCTDMIRKTTKQIKNMTYKLCTVVADGEYHMTLAPNTLEEVEIMEDTPVYCKMYCKGFPSPAKIVIKYISKSDLTVFTSFTRTMPDKNHCDSLYTKPNKFYIQAKDQSRLANQLSQAPFTSPLTLKNFPNEFIYLSLYSLKGCTVKISMSFPDHNPARRLSLATGGQDENYSENEAEVKEREKQERIMSQLKKRVIEEPVGDHLIQKNKDHAKFWPQIKSRSIRERKSTFTERARRYNQQKKMLIKEHMEKSKIYLQRWEVMKQKQKEQQRVMRKIENQNQFKKIWIVFVQQHKAVKLMFDELFRLKEQRIIEKKKYFYGTKLYIKIQNSLAKQSIYSDQRMLYQAIYSMDFFAQANLNIIQARAKRVFKDFILSSSNHLHVKSKFLHFSKTISSLQSRWLKIKEKKKDRMKLLLFKYELELENMIDYCNESKSKKSRALLRKLENIKPEVKQNMLELYYTKVRTLYAARFYEWRKFQLAKKDLPFENTQKMEKKIEQVKKIHSYIYEGIDPSVLISSKRLHLNQPCDDGEMSVKKKKPKTFKSMIKKSMGSFQYKRDQDIILNLPTPPFFLYIPQTQEMQLLIKKCCMVKSVDDIEDL
ncbi:unnamed protein product [Moneuplotes crassus]|uniref:Uncharacterized protein n=1 Tax=Euplotes crassus TaxID=5936 RepID=A0AAD1U4T6_EUPCR|nr:unnamed protein product [Moneuplotes crassus]